jgi:hypothetical protein
MPKHKPTRVPQMKYISAAYLTLPPAALLFGLGILGIAHLDLTPKQVELAFSLWCVTCLIGWLVALEEQASRGGN